MGRYCSVCEHEYRADIDAALVLGVETQKDIAERYGLGKDAIRRHKNRHLNAALVAMHTAEQAERKASLLERVEVLIDRAELLYNAACEDGKAQQALAVIKELRGCLELLGKATGELASQPQVVVNLMATPEWLTLRGQIFAALAPYPEARAALSGELLEIGNGT